MATQPIDRKNVKHISKVAKRVAPQLVNRSNKRLVSEVSGHHVELSGRAYARYNHKFFNWKW